MDQVTDTATEQPLFTAPPDHAPEQQRKLQPHEFCHGCGRQLERWEQPRRGDPGICGSCASGLAAR